MEDKFHVPERFEKLNKPDEPPTEYKSTPFRWLILLAYVLVSSASCFMMVNFAPLQVLICKVYKVSGFTVSNTIVVFLISTMLLPIVASQTLETSGLMKTFRGCAVATIAGVWMRYGALYYTDNFRYVIFGQILAAVAQPFLLNGVSKVSTVWFPDNERALATTIGSLASPVGVILAWSVPSFMISEDQSLTKSQQKQEVLAYVQACAIIATAASSLVLISFKEKPDHFPSASAKAQQAVEFDVATDLKLLKENGNYRWITISFMMTYGYYTGMGALMNGLMAPYGYNLRQTGSIASAFILSGIAGSFVFSILLGKT